MLSDAVGNVQPWWIAEGLAVLAYMPVALEFFESCSPTPEAALIQAESRVEVEDALEDAEHDALREELGLVLACALPIDIEILYLREIGGLSQTTIGERVGLGQVAISCRLIALRRWIAYVLPRRIEMRRVLGGRTVPEGLDDLDAEILRLNFWEHVSQMEIARRLGITQGKVRYRLQVCVRRFPIFAGSLLRGKAESWLWIRPTSQTTRGS